MRSSFANCKRFEWRMNADKTEKEDMASGYSLVPNIGIELGKVNTTGERGGDETDRNRKSIEGV
ncbi:MAG: hypothetical protein Q8909_07855 [Bacteroidota bacterium]|nr:hypothetical protein [Bacteroidota bacterium]